MEMFLQKPNGDEVRVKKVYLRLARSQDINRYTFPREHGWHSTPFSNADRFVLTTHKPNCHSPFGPVVASC